MTRLVEKYPSLSPTHCTHTLHTAHTRCTLHTHTHPSHTLHPTPLPSARTHAHTLQVFQNMAAMTPKTPLWDVTGLMPSEDRPADSVCSMASIQDNLSAKTKAFATKYGQFVVEYVIEWEKVVRTRIDAGIKKSEALRRDLDHYQKKVEGLRLETNKIMSKGKQVKPEAAERLKRNEEKFVQSKQTYNKVATDLCILMEEVTERTWRDLHPVLIKVSQFEMTLANEQAKILGSLNTVVQKLKDVASSNGIPAQPRLKDMATLKPELLSTRPGGVTNLAIEAGSSFSPTGGTGNSSFSFMAQPPGSVGPQGMGGFPVQVGNSNTSPTNLGLTHSSSTGSYGNNSTSLVPSSSNSAYEPPSTLSMLQISAASAPPPTLDDVYSINNRSMGSLPPMSTGMNQQQQYPRSQPGHMAQSLDGYGGGPYTPTNNDTGSVYSGYSGYSAGPLTAAPAAPPPPPPMQPPPSFAGSSYQPPPMMVPNDAPPDPPSSQYGGYGGYQPPPPQGYHGYQPAPSYAAPAPPYGADPTGGYQRYGAQPSPQQRSSNNPFG
jgi:hypothetical protein